MEFSNVRRSKLLGVPILLCYCTALAGAQVAQIQAQLAATRSKLTSASLQVSTTTTYGQAYYELQNKSRDQVPETSTSSYNWSFKGDKNRFESEDQQQQPSGAVNLVTTDNIFDGKSHITVCTTQSNSKSHLTLVRGDSQRNFESPLTYGYMVGDEWASDVVNDNNFTLVGNSNDDKFGQLLQLKGKRDKYLPYTIWISPSNNYLIVKTQAVFNKDVVTHEVKTIDNVDGILIPTKSEMHWMVDQNGRPTPYIELAQSVSAQGVNNVPDILFEAPALKEGDMVKDERLGAFFQVDNKGKLKKVSTIGQHVNTTQASSGFSWVGLIFILSGATLAGVIVSTVIRPKHKVKS